LTIGQQPVPIDDHPMLVEGQILLPYFYDSVGQIHSPHATIEPFSDTSALYTQLVDSPGFAMMRITKSHWTRLFISRSRVVEIPLHKPLEMRTDQDIGVRIGELFSLTVSDHPIMER